MISDRAKCREIIYLRNGEYQVSRELITRQAKEDFSGWIDTKGLLTPEEVIVKLMNIGLKHGLVYAPPFALECNTLGLCKGQKEINARLINAAPALFWAAKEFLAAKLPHELSLAMLHLAEAVEQAKGELQS